MILMIRSCRGGDAEVETIRKAVPCSELLAGLAEEACELSQAALKLRRVIDGRNPTPVSPSDANTSLHEEIADVLLYIIALQPSKRMVEDFMIKKKERWEQRLKEAKAE